MIRLGVAIKETWNFFNDIYIDLQKHYNVSLFKYRKWELPIFNDRINQYFFRSDLGSFLRDNDVVFYEWASELLIAATRLPKVCGIVTRLHRYEMYRWVDRVNWNNVDKIIVVSQAKKNEFVKRFPDQERKVVVNGPSTSLEKFFPQPKVFKGDIGILCNLTPRKRVYDLILTFYELSKKNDQLHLHIGGGMDDAYQDYYHALNHLVKDLNLGNRITFYGPVINTWDWYHNIDVFVSNSYSEGLQVAPMEAMACGCYCLAHRWNGADELLPDENLYYTNDELKIKILQYCELPEEVRNMQRGIMRSTAEKKFDINRTIEKIEEVIDEVAIYANGKYGKK